MPPQKPPARSKRPYDSLGPTQRWKRRKQALADITNTLQQTGCPIGSLQLQPRATPAELVHLSTATREEIRSVPSLRIPCERTIAACKQLLAQTHGTETGTFANGAYLTDPVRCVSVLCAQSSFLAVGGDCGGGHTKLGVTYAVKGVQHFAALVVYAGGDSYEELLHLTHEVEPPFVGDSAAFPHIFAALQHLIDTLGAFLNGDWCFLNAVLGLMAPAATHPCPICIVSKGSLLHSARYRTPADQHSRLAGGQPLLTIPPERIVPTPLHLFLGISNRIILDAYKELFGEAPVVTAVAAVKTVHSAGCGGLGDLYDLNGPEISKFIKQKRSAGMLDASPAAGGDAAATKATHSLLSRWLQQLHDSLLHSRDWTGDELACWSAAVDDIQQHWCVETSQAAFPKLHMLRHSLEFAERHRFLGRASEAQIESFHHQFNTLFHDHHLNQGRNTGERLRRSLADATLRAVQPFLSS